MLPNLLELWYIVSIESTFKLSVPMITFFYTQFILVDCKGSSISCMNCSNTAFLMEIHCYKRRDQFPFSFFLMLYTQHAKDNWYDIARDPMHSLPPSKRSLYQLSRRLQSFEISQSNYSQCFCCYFVI